MGEDDADDGRNDGEDSSRPGTKPQLRVFIPGQKEFVPRTVSGFVGRYSAVEVDIQYNTNLHTHMCRCVPPAEK